MSDDDKRPRLYGKVATEETAVELTVQGSADEESSDLSDTFTEKLNELVEAAEIPEEEDTRMHQ